MKKIVWTFGLISGAVVSLLMIATVPFRHQIGLDNAEILGYATMVAAFLFIFFGVRAYRENVAGGSVKFGRAFAVGALIALISSVCYTATWEVVYFKFMPDFMDDYSATVLQQAKAKGATPAELDTRAAELKKYGEMYKNPAINVAMTMLEPLPVGLIVALVSAGILSRKRRIADLTPTA
jgi:hypothetical protein